MKTIKSGDKLKRKTYVTRPYKWWNNRTGVCENCNEEIQVYRWDMPIQLFTETYEDGPIAMFYCPTCYELIVIKHT